jgi:DNA-directed RNA polymerase subunit RPC12/RpoP
MVGVQDEIECPKCGYKHAFYEFQTRNGEEYTYCSKCGYSFQSILLVDRIRSKKADKKLKLLYDRGEIDKAYKLCRGISTIDPSITNNTKIEEIKFRLKYGFNFIKKRKDGSYIYRIKESGGCGSYSYMSTENSYNDRGEKIVVGSSGSLPFDEKKKQDFINWLKSIKERFNLEVKVSLPKNGTFETYSL